MMAMIDLDHDPLDEVKIAKRWALAGTLGAVFALVPIYGLLLGLSAKGIAFVLAPAALTSLLGIELTSRWEHSMHRRYAYPHQLGCELASILDFSRACQRGVEIVTRWLQARAAVVGWLSEDGETLVPVATHGIPLGWVEDAPGLALADEAVKTTFQQGRVIRKRSAAGDPSRFLSDRRRRGAGAGLVENLAGCGPPLHRPRPGARAVRLADGHAALPGPRRWLVGGSKHAAHPPDRAVAVLFSPGTNRRRPWLCQEDPENAA